MITCEDNMELMARYEDNYFDLAIVDPPYGIDIAKWDKIDLKPNDDYFKELFRVSKNQIIWGGNYFNLPHNQGWLCWDKTFSEAVRGKSISTSKIKKENISEFELAWVSFLKKAKFVRYTNCGNLQDLCPSYSKFHHLLRIDQRRATPKYQTRVHHCVQKKMSRILASTERSRLRCLPNHPHQVFAGKYACRLDSPTRLQHRFDNCG